MQYPNFYSFWNPNPPTGFLKVFLKACCKSRLKAAWLLSLFFMGAQFTSFGQPEFPCEENSLLVTPCYIAGNPTDPGFLLGDEAAIVAFPYSSSTTTVPTAQPDADRSMRVFATIDEVGSVWGMAHQRSNNLIFASSVLKRHAGYGPLGSGGIYVIQVDGNLAGGSVSSSLSFRMDDLTLDNGSGTVLTADPNLTTNSQRQLNANGFTDSPDPNAFSGVGKASLGDIDISEDESTLWVTNLYDRSLYEIPIGAPMEARPTTASKYTIPDETLRPWAVKVRLGKVYVGAVDPDAIEASVWVFDIASKTWDSTPLITVDLQFNRGNLNSLITPGSNSSANWNDWADTWAELNPPVPSGVDDRPEFGHPQPILSDIEFADNGKLILGFLDRGGMQLGVLAVAPDPNFEGLFTGDAAGDILVAQANAAGQYILEENGALNPVGKNIGGDVPQNPGDSEFISEDFYSRSNISSDIIHEEVTLGGLAYLSSSNEVATIAYDPLSVADIPGLNEINTLDLEDAFEFSGGASWFSLDDGSKQRGFMVFSQLDYQRTISFGKASGLGDLELFCSAVVPEVLCATTTGSLSPVPFIDSVEACYNGTDCVEITAEISEEPEFDEGYSVLYVLTATEDLVIEETNSTPTFCADGNGLFTIHTLVYDPNKLDLSGIVLGETTAQEVLELAASVDTCTQLDVAGASFVIDTCEVDLIDTCITDAGSLTPRAFPDSVDVCYDGENCVEIIADIGTPATLDTGYTTLYVLTAGDDLVIQGTDGEPVFCVEDTGKFTIHTLVYDPTKLDLSGIVPGETTGGDVLDLIAQNDTCAKLDVEGAMFLIDTCTTPPPPPCLTDAGSLSPRAFPDSVEGCYDGENCVEIVADIETAAILDTGYSTLYVLTSGDALVIQETNGEPIFCVEDTGKFTIHTLVYDPTKLDLSGITPGETTGGDVLELIALNDTCAKLDVEGAMFQIDTCTTDIPPEDCITDAGSLSPRAFPDSVEGCYDGENCVEIVADIETAAILDTGYSTLYVLTSGDALVIQETNGEPIFCVEDTGKFTIHTLVYDPTKLDLSGITPGETTGGDVLELIAINDTCAKLDVEGAMFQIDTCTTDIPPEDCITDAGSLSPRAFPDSVEGCYDGENCVEIVADIETAAILDTGYSTLYVLTSGDALVIQETNGEPIFCVEDTGKFTIHTLVYDPTKLDLSGITPGETTGGDVLELIAINDTCAKLDVEGAMFQIDTCTTDIPPEDCITDAGSLSPRAFPDSVEGCYDGENCVEIVADIETAAILDTGYSTLYVLTSGDALVIQETNGEPIFCVEDTGKFTIHTLVYDPTKLDLSGITPGETTGGDVLELIALNDTCAKLDVEGAMFQIDTCTTDIPPEDCITDAGSLSPRAFPDSVEGCYDGENCVEIVADIETAAILDTGYSTLYVLTSGDALVIQETSGEPIFCVEDTGKFTIHTLVYDPTKLDLSGITPGETTGGDVLELIAINDTCAKLDVEGAMFQIDTCTTDIPPEDCITDAGSLSPRAFPDSVEGCYDGENCVEIVADIETAAILDTGYSTLYVLTSGDALVIQETNGEPIFCVEDTGKFTIHTLVYDPTKLDLSGITPGETTGGDVLELIAINDTCAKLDVEGAMFQIDTCTTEVDTCISSAGRLVPREGQELECYDGNECVELSAERREDEIIPDGYSRLWLLSFGEDKTVINTEVDPFFCVDSIGLFTIHTLVYDLNVFDPADSAQLSFGVTTITDIQSLFAQEDTCSKVDAEGAEFMVEDCGACPRDAKPSAGSLVAVTDTCFDGESTLLVAEEDEAPMVPDGYIVTYVLTQGDDLIITSTASEPSFSVGTAGKYTIHTLVYDTLTIELNPFLLDGAMAADLLGVLDSVCADLDVTGAMFTLDTCKVDPCIDVDISAGTLIGTLDSCYNGTPVKIAAEHGTEPIIPEGYVSIYALTQGSDLVVADADTVPMFMVEGPGTYRIHTFVFDSTDLDVDLSFVELGTTTAAEILALLGDSICADLDVEGALFEIEPCLTDACPDSLDIDAGTLEVVSDSCYDGATPVMLVAEHGMDPVIPEGYSSVYVLTQGTDLVIIDTDTASSFKVEGLGRFTIHTLVYDPMTLDLGIVVPGSTTAAQVLDVLGDSICAALDVMGAPFDILPCTVDSTCEDIKDYVLSSWGADRNANADHSVFLFHSPADPDRMMLGNRDFQQYFWETSGTLRVFMNEMGELKDTATITGIIASEIDPAIQFQVEFVLVNPMTWDEHSAMGGDYKANLFSTEVADSGHVNWQYWEISDASKLIGLGAIDGLVFDVVHAPSDLKYKLQVGYGANDKDGSYGLSGWFGYTGEFDGVSYSAQGDINVDIDTCIVTEICEPIISASTGSWIIRNVSAMAVYDRDPRVQISWSAFSSNPNQTIYSIDKSEDGGRFYETIETLRASKNRFKYEYTDEEVVGHNAYSYRIRVVMEGEAVTTTADVGVSLDRVLLQLDPNPANKVLHVSANNPHIGSYRLQLLNSQGQVIGVEQVRDLVRPYPLDISKLAAGFYFVRVTTPEEGVQMLRFVKQ